MEMPWTGTEIMARDIMTEMSLSSPYIMDMKCRLQVIMFSAYIVNFITIEMGRVSIWKI